MRDRLREAVAILHEKKQSCVILWEGRKDYLSCDIGIKPLMVCLRRDRHAFEGGVIADKVIGKAAALMALLGGASAVYADVMSEAAAGVLGHNQLYYEYREMVPYISNRTHTGRCPMEETVADIENPGEAFEALERTIARLMQEKTR